MLLIRFPVSRILRVDELEFLGHRWSRAKYAAAFFRNSFSIFSSRVSRSSSRSRARSFTVSGGSSPACSRDRKSTRLNSSHPSISYAVFCLRKKIGRYVQGTHDRG